jgi:TrmH family RNA methyltransferase
MVHRPLEDLGPQALVVVAVGLADPGNLGTLLRSAEAAGAAVVVAGDSVDPYNPKAVRASAGTLLAVPLVVDADVLGVLDALGRQGYRRLATVVHGGSDYVALDWGRPSALVLGNEAAGLDDATLAACDERVSVPMVGRAESLNVAMAGTVLCFEALAARRRPGGSVAGASAAGSTMPPMSAGRPPAR